MSVSINNRISQYVRAGFSGIWIQTQEPFEAQQDLESLCLKESWEVAVWDLGSGLRWPLCPGKASASSRPDPTQPWQAPTSRDEDSVPLLIVMHNYHKFLDTTSILQGTSNALQMARSTQVVYLVLAPTAEIPPELEKAFIVVKHPLPDREELTAIANRLLESNSLSPESLTPACVEAARGLTRREAENAFSLALFSEKDREGVIWDLATESVASTGFMTMIRGQHGFEKLGGMQALKDFSLKLCRPENRNVQGLLLLGPAGTGKSQYCLALGKETGRPVLMLNMGLVHSKYVGGSEHNLAKALATADAMGKVILMVDEINLALGGGANGNSEGDSGVSSRVFGQLLTWLADRERTGSEVMLVGTANSARELPAAFARPGRFDALFFLDLPDQSERHLIWKQYLAAYGLDPAGLPAGGTFDDGWTGAEIKQACRLASVLKVPLKEAVKLINPVAKRSAQEIEELRRWATGRCQSASTWGPYQMPLDSRTLSPTTSPTSVTGGRKLKTD